MTVIETEDSPAMTFRITDKWHYPHCMWVVAAVLTVSKLLVKLYNHLCAEEKKAFCQAWGREVTRSDLLE